jgi:hypothetical protein
MYVELALKNIKSRIGLCALFIQSNKLLSIFDRIVIKEL